MRRSTPALIVAALALTLALGAWGGGAAAATRPSPRQPSSGGLSTTFASANPPEWVTVAWGQATLAIPSNWYVLYDQPPCVVGGAPGELFVDPLPGVFHCPPVVGRDPSTVVTLEQPDPAVKVGKTVLTIHGITVRKATSAFPGTYLVPVLHAQIRLEGRIGLRVLHTLETSARRHVLAHGQAPPVPAGWRHVSFAGLRVAIPAAWPVSRTNLYGFDCSPLQTVELFTPPSAVLDTDTRLILPACPYIPPAQPPQPASQGLRIDERSLYPELPPSAFGHCLRIHRLRACPANAPAFSILVLRVSVPGRAHPVYVSIGLVGTGSVARTILDSLRAS